MKTITFFLLVGILGYTLLNPNCNCANDNYDATMNFSPVYSTDKISVFKRLQDRIGMVAPNEPETPAMVLKSTPNTKEMECLRNNIYFESRGEHDEGQKAVGFVTISRMNDPKFPDTICKVVHQRKQFSWTNDQYSNNPKRGKTLDKAERIAKVVWYQHQLGLDTTRGKLFFNTSHRSGQKIGNHYFY